MKGNEFAKTLPGGYTAERDELIYQAVKAGHAVPPVWLELGMVGPGDDFVVVYVMEHALQIGETRVDGLTVNVSPITAQRIADLEWAPPVALEGEYGPTRAFLPTTRMIDQAWRVADAYGAGIQPHPQNPGSGTAKMIANSDWVRQETERCLQSLNLRSDLPGGQKVLHALQQIFGVNAGKHYPLTNKTIGKTDSYGVPLVANYGWFGGTSNHRTATGLRCWQPLGTAHNVKFCDYSQIVWLVHGHCLVNGDVWPLERVLQHERLAQVVSDEGWLRTTRLAGTHVDVTDKPTDPPPAPKPTAPPPPRVPTVTFKLEPWVRERWIAHYGVAITQTIARYANTLGITDQVKAWQTYIQVAADGDPGPITEKATIERQKVLKVPATGIVDQATVIAAAAGMAEPSSASASATASPTWIPAKNFTPATRKRGDIYWLVVHTMEAPEKPTTAEAVAHWFGGASAPQASAHFCVDNDSVAQGVQLKDVAWAAPGANRYGIQYEQSGYAKQTAAEWDDEFSRAQLELLAALMARHAVDYDIPIRRVTVDELKQARALYQAGKAVPRELWGICGHHDTSQAWKLSTHYDPGTAFPWATFVEKVNQYKRQILAGS